MLGRFDRRSYPPQSTLSSWVAADGWHIRTFDWKAAGTGAVLFAGGRGDFIEKYLELFADLHARGWSVRAFDWRGQGGSGRLSADPLCGHAADFAPWVEDVAAIARDWQRDTPGPHIVIGHSMGGHLMLRALAERRITPDAAVLVAPMLGLRSAPFGAKLAARVAAFMAKIGRPERMAWKANERPSVPGASRRALLTHDPDRYADELWWRREKPEIALGPPSWAWVAAAYRSTLALESPGRLEAIAVPVLLVGTEADRLVDPAAIRRAAARLPHAELHMFGRESAHEILREADPVRNRALSLIEAFLAKQRA